MFEKLGVVTNIWSEEMGRGTSFEDLMVTFGQNGFKDMEVREGEYLRNSEFGELIGAIEAAIPAYTDAEFKSICDAVWAGGRYETEHHGVFQRVAAFVTKTSGLTLSYAMSHPWLSAVDGTEDILRAKKVAYLLCPARPRLRLVDLETEGAIDEVSAVANLKRYGSLLPSLPMIFAVENARQPATLALKLAVGGGAKLTYDETNTYGADGTPMNPPEEFWSAVRMADFTSVHFKQKTEDGVLSVVGDGFVDFGRIAAHLKRGGYTGDLLLENAPTVTSLRDALQSREYLLGV